MLLVVASIGSDGLLGMEALQLCLSHQLERDNCGWKVDQRYNCTNRD